MAAEALAAADQPAGSSKPSHSLLHIVPRPAHWQTFGPNEEMETRFIRLPWPLDDDVGDDSELKLSPEDLKLEQLVKELHENGVPQHDARAALQHCHMDVSKASEFIAQVG